MILKLKQKKETHGVLTRRLDPRDRPRVRDIIASCKIFTPEESDTALELLDTTLAQGEEVSGYLFAVLEDRRKDPVVQGYVCYGPTPLTQGVYDLYWIVVDPATRGKGYGRRLIGYAEIDAARRGGRMMIVETSSQESYKGTIRFYRRTGYELVARIKDFYRIGDDKLVFSKNLG